MKTGVILKKSFSLIETSKTEKRLSSNLWRTRKSKIQSFWKKSISAGQGQNWKISIVPISPKRQHVPARQKLPDWNRLANTSGQIKPANSKKKPESIFRKHIQPKIRQSKAPWIFWLRKSQTIRITVSSGRTLSGKKDISLPQN